MTLVGATAAGLWTLEAALERMLQGVEPRPADEVPLEAALGRVLADPIIAAGSVPPWDNSAMDGFAVRAADVAGASPDAPVVLRVVGESSAGHAPLVSVGEGSAVRVLTGAMIPDGADAVVPVEETDAPAGVASLPTTVAVRRAPGNGAHVRRAGSDHRPGQLLVPAGTLVRPATAAVIASSGSGRVRVHPAPRVTVLSTGDELVAAGEPLGPARIHDTNGPMLRALAVAAGAEVRALPPVGDDLAAIEATLADAVASTDIVVASGGVSVGAHDLVRLAFERLGRVELWRVAVQPGKPLAFGRAGETLLFGLPGNPVSSFVTFEIFVRPLLRRLAGHADPLARRVIHAVAGEELRGDPDRRAFLRVRIEREDPATTPRVTLAGGQGSHVLSALAVADGLAIKPEGAASIPAGAPVDVWELG